MPLTDIKLRAAKPQARGYRLPDGGGLHLFVTPRGIKSWRWRYEVEGRERTLALGRYPALSLAEARRARRPRAWLASGHDLASAPAARSAPSRKPAGSQVDAAAMTSSMLAAELGTHSSLTSHASRQ